MTNDAGHPRSTTFTRRSLLLRAAVGGAMVTGVAPLLEACGATSAPPATNAASSGAVTSVATASQKPAAGSIRLTFGANQASTSFYPYFVSVAKAISEVYPEISVSIFETGGGYDNLRGLSRGEQQFGQVGADDTYLAYKGLGRFAGSAQPNLRYLWVYGIFPQHVTVRADAGLKSLRDLDGKVYSPGQKGTSTEAQTDAAFKALGVTPKWLRGSWDDITSAIKEGRAIGYTKGGSGFSPDATQLDIATATKLTVIGYTDKELETVLGPNPQFSTITVPANAMKSLIGEHGAYKTLALALGVATVASLPEETAYKIVKAVNENRAPQDAAFSGVKGVNFPTVTMDTSLVPLHPGAVRYYRETGISIPPRLVPTT